MAEVVLQNVRKVYAPERRGGLFGRGKAGAEVEAVRDFNLRIADGEFVVLVGPSGCGKSTMLRMIAGLEDISGGTVWIGGRVVNEVHPKDRDIAMVFQNYALYPHMTVYKNMAFALSLRGVPKVEIERRVREAARTLGIEELLDRKPRALSGGQRQRVAVGRAIVREPKAFLFDEPLSNLDAKLRVTTRAELKALHMRLKTTTVYVTHDQEEAMTLGDRVVVMSKGVIQQAGTPLEVYRRPANRFVASFVGTPPMNFISGTLVREGSDLYFQDGPPGPDAMRLRVARAHAAKLWSHADRDVVLGLRPQAIREAGDGAQPEGSILDLAVQVIEPLGDSMDIFAAAARGQRIVARVPAREGLSPGSRRAFAPDMESAYYFEPGEFGPSLLS
jgi:multiple sugar transport system ATP-binding protein